MVRLFFGTDVATDYIPPAPLTNITGMYKQVIQSAMKTFLSGAIATENVPGGYIEEQTVFVRRLTATFLHLRFCLRSSRSPWWWLSLGRDGLHLRLLTWLLRWLIRICLRSLLK
jgi:hypothetical protein